MEKTENKAKERIKKEYAPNGQRSQKLMCFRCDLDNLEWLNQQPNKGRAINNLIRKERGV